MNDLKIPKKSYCRRFGGLNLKLCFGKIARKNGKG